MASTLTLISLCVLVGIVATQAKSIQPKPCCLPNQWTGKVGETVGYNSPKGSGSLGILIDMTYDYTNKQMAMNEQIYGPGYQLGMRVIMKKQKVYAINTKTKKCTVMPAKAGIMPPCIASNATYYGAQTLGIGSNTLKVDVWNQQIASKFMRGTVTVSVTKDCIPIGEVIQGMQGKTGFMAAVGLHDIVKGVKDPSVFDIPASCKEEDAMHFNSAATMHVFNSFLR